MLTDSPCLHGHRIVKLSHTHVSGPLQAGQISSPGFPHLPDELWHHVASHLSTKDWVGASGTCRQLRQLQLPHLNIRSTSADGSISTLLWLAKQLPNARSLVLHGWPVKSALQQEVADHIRSMMQPALSSPVILSNLAVVSVRLGPSEYERARQLEKTGDHPHMGMCLAPILLQAAKLSKLELVCMTADGLPSVGNLKHLALRLHRFPMNACISSLLEGLPCLETLQLSHPFAIDGCMGVETEAKLVVPASVQRVELINVYPELLVLGSNSTTVRLIGVLCCLQEALGNWPDDVRSQLKGLRLFQRRDEFPGITSMEVSDLWDYVEVLQLMRFSGSSVNVNLHGLPRASLSNLTSLHVKMMNLCITIPALPHLKDLRLDCSRTLCMSFEDAGASTENLVDFEMVFASICEDNTFTLFLADLATAKKICAFQQYCKMQKCLRHPDGSSSEECKQQKYFRVHSGSYRVAAPIDTWEDLFTACGCEGCLAGQGFGLKWASQGRMVYSRTGYVEEITCCRPGEAIDGLIQTKCPCDVHGIFAESDDWETDDDQ